MRAHSRLILPLVFLVTIPAPALTQPTTVFQGSQVVALGGATFPGGPAASLSFAPAGTRLYVGNLSYSGSDGCSVQIGGGNGGLVGFLDEAASFPVGGEMRVEVRGDAGIDPCVRLVRDMNGVVVHPDLDGASSYRVEVWNDGAPVSWAEGASGGISRPGFPTRFEVSVAGVIAPLPDPFPLPAGAPFSLRNSFRLYWSANATFLDDVGGPLGTGDELRVYPTGGLLTLVASIDVLVKIPVAMPPYTMSIDDLAQEQFSHMHRGTGGAIITCTAAPHVTGRETMAALSHHRGVDASIPPGALGGIKLGANRWETGGSVKWSNSPALGAGDTDQFTLTGELSTGGLGNYWGSEATHTGSGFHVVPYFNGGSTPGARVEVFNALGVMVGSSPNHPDFAWLPTYNPTDTDYGENFKLIFGAPVAVNLPGVGTFTGTSVVMSPTTPVPQLALSAFERSVTSATGGTYSIGAEPGTFRIAQEPGEVEYRMVGTSYGAPSVDGIVIHDFESGLSNGVQIEPCILPAGTSPVQFGIEWAPLGPPSASPSGQTDWAFLSKLAGDPAPVERIGVSMRSDGMAVKLFKNPGPSQTPVRVVLLSKTGQVVASFTHSDPQTPFAELPDWPIGVGYRELVDPQAPWSMWIDLGYEMDVVIPGGSTSASASATAMPLTKAQVIAEIAQQTPNPGPAEKRMLKGTLYGFPFLLIPYRPPTPVAVGDTPGLTRTVLHPAYPNPFNPRTTIAFELAQAGHVSLKIYAVDGRLVTTVHDGTLSAGPHRFDWTGLNHRGNVVASGVYLAELRAPDGTLRTKVNLLK